MLFQNKPAFKWKNDKICIPGSWILLFSAPFIVWQMGIIYFSGTTMSLLGRTPVPLTESSTTFVIALGYLLSIILICFFPRNTVLLGKIVLFLAISSTLLLFFPLSSYILSELFYLSAFCCVFMIGITASVAAHLLTVDTTWRDGIFSMIIGGILIAILQNDLYKIDFVVFNIASCLFIILLIIFFHIIPSKIHTFYITRKQKVKPPVILMSGLYFLIIVSTLLICFSTSFAESVPNGISIIYLSASVWAAILLIIKKIKAAVPVKSYGAFFLLSAFGFVLAVLSLHIPGLQPVACIFIGFIIVIANLWLFFTAMLFEVYPTRFTGAIGAGIGLLLAMFHSMLLELLRDRTELLYSLYALLAVGLMVVYYFIEPYFTYAWKRMTARDTETAPFTPEPPAPVPAPLHVSHAHPFDILSDQERILAQLILQGYTETSIAENMNITLNTQKSYRKNLYAKLDIHSKRELFAITENE